MLEKLESQQLKVKKWWWENAAEFKKSPENVILDFKNSIKQVIVVSAVRSDSFNTTDNLINVAELLNKWDLDEAYEKIVDIEEFHKKVLIEKYWENEEIKNFITNYFIDNLWRKINDWINYKSDDKIYPIKDNDYTIWYWDESFSIIGFWEELSANLQVKLINNLDIDWLKAKKVDLNWIVKWLEKESESVIFEKLSSEIRNRVEEILELNEVPIISWYIPGFKWWIENKIGRWYSDATAAMTSVWLWEKYDVTLEIQKSVLGMLSADPRIISDAKLIESIDYLTAKEITGVRWSQAKLLHSQVLRKELLKKWINVRLFDPFSHSKGTLITKNKNPDSSGIEYIWARDNIIFFSISSWDMADSWILAKVFEAVKKYNISVDIVSTSETEISFTIDNWIKNEILDSLVKDIQKQLDIEENDDINFVKYEKNKALLFCIGQNLAQSTWALSKATTALALENINVELMSQWSMERSMVFGIDAYNKNNAIEILHKEFIK